MRAWLKVFLVFLATAMVALAQVNPGVASPGFGAATASNLLYTPPWTGAGSTTQATVNARQASAFDLMTAAQIADVKAGTETQDVTTALINICNRVPANVAIYFPAGVYKISGSTPIVRSVSGDIIFDSGAVIDATATTGSNIFQITGSRGTCYVNTVAITQGDRSFTCDPTLAATLAPHMELQVTTDHNAGGNGMVWYGGQTVFCQGEFIEVEQVCTAQVTGTTSGTVLTLTANTGLGAIPTTYPVALTGPGVQSGLTITGLNSGSANTSGAVYQLSGTPTAYATTSTFYTGLKATFPALVIIKNPFKDSYAAGASVSGVVNYVRSTIQGFRLYANNYQANVQCGLAVNYAKDLRIVGGQIDGCSWACCQVARTLGAVITGLNTSSQWYNATGYGYGLQFATVQAGMVTNCRLQADRNAMDIGGWEPTRDVKVVGCVLGTDNNTEKALGTHGNCETITVTNCTVEGGLTMLGKIWNVEQCQINTRYPIIMSTDYVTSTWSASLSGSTMTITTAGTGSSAPVVGMTVTGTGIPANTTITALTSANSTFNQVGATYTLSQAVTTESAEAISGTMWGWPVGSGLYHTLRNNQIYIVNAGNNNYGIEGLYMGAVDRLNVSGNQVWGGAGLVSGNLMLLTQLGAPPAYPVVSSLMFADNALYSTNNTVSGLVLSSVTATDVKVLRNEFNIPGNGGPVLQWSTNATSTNISILENYFTNTATSSSSIKLTTSGANIIRYNRNIYYNPNGSGTGVYYAIALRAATSIEAVGNTANGFRNGDSMGWLTAVAPNVLYADNTLLNCAGTPVLGGKYYGKLLPGGKAETFAAANPVSGLWAVGDQWDSSVVTATTSSGSVCTTAGYGYKEAWTTGHAYVMGQYVTSNSNTYMALTTGTAGASAPSGTGSPSDGTVTWIYIAASTTAAVWTARIFP